MTQTKVLRLLSETERHPKVIKNMSVGVLGFVMHLSPADRSGYEVCPMRSAGCTAACLNTAGFHYARKETARINRTKMFFEQREDFMTMLMEEIHAADRKANKNGYICGIRLNGTSDIPWENIRCGAAPNIMSVFPHIPFMDYTKRWNRKNLPDNYKLTFSRSEDNEEKCLTALKNGMNVAVVFRAKSEDKLPETWRLGSKKLRVIDGDLHDWRYGDYYDYPDERVIVGLRSKGSVARRDESGFIVDMPKSPEQQRMWDRSMKNADYQVERNRRIAMACA